jgi:hypothetical protein
MNLMEWSKSSVDYGRKLVNSAVEGARDGEDEFLDVQEEALAPYLGESARHAIRPAVIGAGLGVLAACVGSGQRSGARIVVGGLLGGALGFGAGLLWDSRQLTASVTSGAWKSINKTRDEHWLETHPIDYA